MQASLYATKDGFQTLAYPPRVDSTIGARRGGQGAVLGNGNVIFVGGESTTATTSVNATSWVSSDNGQSFTIANRTLPFGKFYAQLVAIPNTNTAVIIGGENSAGAETKDIWMTTDGQGAIWTLQSSASNIPTNALAGAIALYDSKYVNPSLYSTPNSTILFFLEYSAGDYWMSYDLGRTWSAGYVYPFATAANSITHRDWLLFAADLDNNIYSTGMYNEPDSFVWMSSTKGQTWSILQQSMSIPGQPTSLQYQWAKYNCMTLQYNNKTSARQLVIYGDQIYMSDGSAWQSLVGQLNVPLGQTGYGTLPNATISVSALPIGSLPSTLYPSCAFNVHSLTSSRLFLAGGATPVGNFPTAAVYTSTNNGQSFTASANPAWSTTPVYNAGSAILSNGNILLIGGQSNTSVASYSSSVYVSTDNGATFTLSTSSAAFGARSNFATCVMPGTNTVVVVGGSFNNNGTAKTDSAVFINQDGTGANWVQTGVLPVTTLAGSCVLLYDNHAVSSSFTNVNSTLLVFTHTNRLYRSYNLGASFDASPSSVTPGPLGYQFLPFSTQFDSSATRYQTEIVADYDNYLWAMGGLNVFDNGIYFSGDLGFTWYRIKQTNNLNSGNFIQSSTSCLGMSYVQSGSSYVKTLSLYGGVQVLFDSRQNYSAITISLDSAPSYIPSSVGSPVSTSLTAQVANAAQLWCVDPSQPSIQWQSATPSTTMPFQQWPLCAADVHQGNPALPTYMYMYGGYATATSANTATMYVTTDGFQTVTSHTDTTIGVRRMGAGAVLSNGDVLIMGGQQSTTAASAQTDVYVSHDKGQTFTFVNNTYPGKYEAQVLVMPYTNWIVIMGGYNAAGGSIHLKHTALRSLS